MLNKLLKIFPKLKSQIIPYSLYTLLASFLDLIGISAVALFASLLLSPEQFDQNFLDNFSFNDKVTYLNSSTRKWNIKIRDKFFKEIRRILDNVKKNEQEFLRYYLHIDIELSNGKEICS